MTFAKIGSRKISVQGEQYLWHLNRKFEQPSHWIVIQHRLHDRQLLCLNPYSQDLDIGPGSVAKAIEFALRNGWDPRTKAAPMYLDYKHDRFRITTRERDQDPDEDYY